MTFLFKLAGANKRTRAVCTDLTPTLQLGCGHLSAESGTHIYHPWIGVVDDGHPLSAPIAGGVYGVWIISCIRSVSRIEVCRLRSTCVGGCLPGVVPASPFCQILAVVGHPAGSCWCASRGWFPLWRGRDRARLNLTVAVVGRLAAA